MPCRIGISTNPAERQKYWEGRVQGLKDWRIISHHPTRGQAQAAESSYARRHGCKSSPGGAAARGQWYVYHFDYTRDMGRRPSKP